MNVVNGRTVLILGASGLLGASLNSFMSSRGYSVVSQSRGDGFDLCFDPTKWRETDEALNKIRPRCVVNTVASTNVDMCETDAGYAYVGNVRPAVVLAGLVEKKYPKMRVINISTDHVYDGSGSSQENDISLVNEYAYTKYAAELVFSKINSISFRTNIIGKSRSNKKQSFTDWLFKSFSGTTEFSLFTDSYISPLHMETLCAMVERAIESEARGVFNVGSHKGMSKAEIGEYFADVLGMDKGLVRKTKMGEVGLVASRPLDMRMDVAKFENEFGVSLPLLKTEILKAAREYKNEV